MQCVYVYYRLPAHDMPLMVAAARAMIGRVQAATGVSARLQRKCDDNNDTATLMEVYEGITDAPGFERALAFAVESSALTAAQRSARHVERFKDA